MCNEQLNYQNRGDVHRHPELGELQPDFGDLDFDLGDLGDRHTTQTELGELQGDLSDDCGGL